MKIHILGGTGSIGSLVATSLAYGPASNTAVNVILRSKRKLQQYLQNGSTLSMERNVGTRTTIDREIAGVVAEQLKPGEIENLVVTTPCHTTLHALQSVKHAIGPQTNVLFLQNGMGLTQNVINKLWPKSDVQRPSFFSGIVSHGVRPSERGPFAFTHTGNGAIKMAAIRSYSTSAFTRARSYTTDSEEAVKADQDNTAIHIPPEQTTTDSEENVRADSELFDLPKEPNPTDSEESVKADMEYVKEHEAHNKAAEFHTDSEANVKAEQHDFEVERKSQPTESEEDVKADYSSFDIHKDDVSESASSVASNNPLLQALANTGLLNAEIVSTNELEVSQLEKLVVNACINPFTVIFQCENGELLQIPTWNTMANNVCKEAFAVFSKEFRNTEIEVEVRNRLDPRRIMPVVKEVVKKTAKNKSSMLVAVQKGMKRTEMPYINGYIVNMASKHHIDAKYNKMLCALVDGIVHVTSTDTARYVPFEF